MFLVLSKNEIKQWLKTQNFVSDMIQSRKHSSIDSKLFLLYKFPQKKNISTI